MTRNPHVPDPSLLTDIQEFIQKYVALPSNEHALVLSVFVLHTWLLDCANVTPYLYIYSADPGSGKTRLMEVLSVITRNAHRAEDMTAPVMFKLIERKLPTLLIDEVDTIWSGSRNEEKRRILNTGYKRGGCSWREQARELVKFSTFSPKVLAGLNNGFMPRTILDRCIPFELKRRNDVKIDRFVESKVGRSAEVENLLDRVLIFCEDFRADVTAQAPLAMTNLSDRQDEISEPLLALGIVLGVEDELRAAIEKLFMSASKEAPNPTQVIFRRIHAAFDGETKAFTEDLCASLGPMYNGRTLALWLEPFRIAPKHVRIGNQVMRGYSIDQFADVFKQHLGLNITSDEEIEDETEVTA